ncbi:MAG TPA: TolC family outer membrane protein [Solimonas sp.]
MLQRSAWPRRWAVLLLVAGCASGAARASEPVDLLTICNDALSLNPRYAAARAEYLAAKQLVPLAKSRLRPQVGLGAAAYYVDHSVEGDYYGLIDIDRSDEFSSIQYGVSVNQALFRADLFLGKTHAELRVRAAGYTLEAAQDLLLLEVAEAYFAVLAAQDALASTEAAERAFGEQAELLRLRTEAGLVTEADHKGAQALHALAEANRLDAANALLTTTARLESLTGKHYPQIKRLPHDLRPQPPEPYDEQVWIRRAQDGNAVVLAQRAAAEVAKIDNERVQKAAWPRLDLEGRLTYLDNGGGVSGEREDHYNRIGVTLRLPIYTGGQISAGLRLTEELQRRAEATVEDVTAKAVRDTRVAYLNSLAGQKRVDALQRAVEASQAYERSARVGYDAGTQSSTDLLQALEQRYRAERDYSLARYMALMSSLRLKAQVGQLLTADIAQINRLLQAPPATP